MFVHPTRKQMWLVILNEIINRTPMKRLLFLFATLLLSAVNTNAQTIVKGDINEDGVVNLADVTALVNLILNGGGGTAQTTTYYWYVGHVTNEQFENSDQLKSIVNGQNPTTSTTGPSTLTIPSTTGDVIVYIYPTIWGTPNIVDDTGYGTGDMSYEEVELTPPTGYNVRFWDGDSSVRGKTLHITWTK